jgi:hypothetical protein
VRRLAEAATALRAIYEAKAEQMCFEGPFTALLLLLRVAAAFVLAADAAASMADGSVGVLDRQPTTGSTRSR